MGELHRARAPGATRPALKEPFPRRGTSGYAAPLEVTVEHGKGETVLPQGFQTQAEQRSVARARRGRLRLPRDRRRRGAHA